MAKSKKKYIPHAWETVACPFCNSEKYKFHENFGPELQYTYVKCLECSLIYQSPRPVYDELFLQHAYSDYFTFNPDYTYTEKNSFIWEKELKEIIKYDNKQSCILDIGSCMGDFLKVSQKYYAHSIGIEVSEKMARFTEDHLKTKIYSGNYIDIPFKEKFSCIHMSHVIEHIPNPKDWLIKSHHILDENGILVISVPHMNSLDRKFKLLLKKAGLFQGKWKDNSRTPDHLFEPTIPGMLKFLKNNDFKVLKYYTYSRKDMDASTLFGKIYNRNLKLGSNLRFFVTPV